MQYERGLLNAEELLLAGAAVDRVYLGVLNRLEHESARVAPLWMKRLKGARCPRLASCSPGLALPLSLAG